MKLTSSLVGSVTKRKLTMHKNQLERKTVSVEQLALSNAYQLEAMINVLEQKGILAPREIWPNWN